MTRKTRKIQRAALKAVSVPVKPKVSAQVKQDAEYLEAAWGVPIDTDKCPFCLHKARIAVEEDRKGCISDDDLITMWEDTKPPRRGLILHV